MDPVSHIALAHTLSTAVGKPSLPARQRLAPAMLGGLAPDIDAVFMPFGWDVYLRVHEIGTHSLLGTVGLAAATAAAARPWTRRAAARDLFAMAWLGCLSHVALDILSGARIRVGWPAIDNHVSVPLVAMADPWLFAILAAGSVAVALSSQKRSTAFAVAACAAAFLAVKSVMLARAWRAAEPGMRGALERVVEAQWASLTRWYVFERDADTLRQWTIEAGEPPGLLLAWPIGPETPRGRTSRSLDTVRNFLFVHELSFPVELPNEYGGSNVLWSDLRFCRAAEGHAGSVWPSPVATATSPAGGVHIACALWAGGAFDRDGRTIRQLVKIGEWWQTRAPQP